MLITSICKESESKTALLHREKGGRGRWGQEGGVGSGGWGKGGAESQRASPSNPEQLVRVRLGGH